MISVAATTFGPGSQRTAADGMHVFVPDLVSVDGVTFGQANKFGVSLDTQQCPKGSVQHFIAIMSSLDEVGLAMYVNADGARDIAAALSGAADKLEATIAGQAAAAIDAARAKGGRS